MTREKIKELISVYLKSPYREISTGWVMTSCPFAEWTHPDGDDKKFSFGISVKNGFHCFTCGIKGYILDLPRKLASFSHFYNWSMHEFIEEWYEEEEYASDSIGMEYILSSIDYDLIRNLPYATGRLFLEERDCKKWDVRYDPEKKIIYFPYYSEDRERIVNLKARLLNIKCFFYISSGYPKDFYGVWFRPKKWLTIVEGERDAIFVSRYVTSWATAGMPTKQMIDKLSSMNKKIILFLDNDDTGRKIKRKLVYHLGGLVPLYEITNYFGCKDPAELFEKGKLEEALRYVRKV